jgi:hypothetical protein
MTEKDIRKLIRESLERLDESRMGTSTLELMGKMTRGAEGVKVLDIRSMVDGMAGLFRYEKDGNAYEIEIRPASLIKDKEFWGNLLKKKEEHPMKPFHRILNKDGK